MDSKQNKKAQDTQNHKSVAYDILPSYPLDATHLEVFDENFADPSANILLKADCTVFRVPLWNLQKHCLYSGKIIDTKVSAPTLRAFLCTIMTGVNIQPELKKLDWEKLVDARNLSDRWDCPIFADAVKQALYMKVEGSPWDLFKASSQINDVDLAKRCLKIMGINPAVDSDLAKWNTGRITLNHFHVRRSRPLYVRANAIDTSLPWMVVGKQEVEVWVSV
ncbi:hypothetical protein TREMEDRAFT_63919 [Tremella mesenterica DSM 1558]|uniref:uncharacterized protein n=1 Tax=Tremella mesenterica (strain ATCC 24925 / CBS 8224 / DSM 1558 / NBRC 9311 / NRRL Y-6157 / RJB 2259-6 / UBC 559-6) TaxID=578456 RepID=UPI0003F49D12|nr:uncharacterized protein TREMEDRAFT_63919 [Tremella mesenterica DSM 1558]EIW68033.1 hypothetical protein TREMEDRAFT_63919 [Tremella mesenterica DSM 1558]